MVIQKKGNEVIIRISSSVLTKDIQQLVDFLRYKEIAQKSKARKADLEELVSSVKRKRRSKTAA
jgi:hypothetical protein